MLKEYEDILGDVRHNGKFHSVTSLVQPINPEVQELADVLIQDRDFVEAAQDFVNSFTPYVEEENDFWRTPSETLDLEGGDCDDKAILLCSILRNYLEPDEVYCAFGTWETDGEEDGHMWVVTSGRNHEDRIVESTASSSKPLKGKYKLMGMFNDKYAFATEAAFETFALRPMPMERKLVAARK